MSIAAVLAFTALTLLMFTWLIGHATVALQSHNEKLLRAQAAFHGGGEAAAAAAAMASCDGGGACH